MVYSEHFFRAGSDLGRRRGPDFWIFGKKKSIFFDFFGGLYYRLAGLYYMLAGLYYIFAGLYYVFAGLYYMFAGLYYRDAGLLRADSATVSPPRLKF